MSVDKKMLDAVRTARAFEEQGMLVEAVNYYLDAAEFAVHLKKASTSESRRDWLDKIARDIVEHVKLLKQKKSSPHKAEVLKEDRAEGPQSNIKYLMMVTNSGTQILGHPLDQLDDTQQIQSNDILFSSAITAIGSIFNETVNRSIEEIHLEDMWLHFVRMSDYTSIVFADSLNDDLKEAHRRFLERFDTEYRDQIQEGIEHGLQIKSTPQLHEMISQYFLAVSTPNL